ncbi:MAG TPA: prolyl oligopeptidase family serine peptidase [Chitinophagaceae bacterium]|jgi:pimeloyl-ACP methyl ester carboxylesterase|nr:prolyl oligopeptidase family serine peptidase [Chitinophagaceae bacterium]
MTDCHYEIKGSDDKPILVDVHLPQHVSGTYPVIIFSHGFKGFKDWGTFNQLAGWFACKGFCFVKFNFSHNGTTPGNPEEFTDLCSFAANTLSKEMDDLGKVIDFVLGKEFSEKGAAPDENRVYLMGHSRGGGIAILKAAEDKRVKKLVTWAAVNDFDKSWTGKLAEKWAKEGKIEVLNSRTGQRMPLNYSLYEDYQAHLDRLYIPAAVMKLKIPFLIVHGRADETVCVRAAYEMNDWNKDCTELYIVEDANHVFGARHPWNSGQFPTHTRDALHKTLNFLLN